MAPPSSVSRASRRTLVADSVAVLDETTGKPLHVRIFDVHAGTNNAAEFAKFMRTLPIGRLVLIAVMAEAAVNLSAGARLVCEQLGSRFIRTLSDGDSWCIVGQVGASPASSYESYRPRGEGAAKVDVSSLPLQSLMANGISIIAKSGAINLGNVSSLDVAGRTSSVMLDRQGINVAVISPEGEVSQGNTFDTNGGFATNSKEFVSWASGLAYGTCVAFSMKGDESMHLSGAARNVFRSFGGILVDEIDFRHSYALVGFKGAQKGTVAEQHSTVSLCYAHYHLTPELIGGVAAINGSAHGFSVSLTSSGPYLEKEARIAVDGIPVKHLGRGINMALIDATTGIISDTHTFDTGSSYDAANDFAALVEKLPVGQVVALAVWDDAAGKLTERSRRASALELGISKFLGATREERISPW